MNQKNFEFLRDQLKYTGFGEGLAEPLRANLQRQEPTFTLEHRTAYGTDEMHTTLYFKKSPETDRYFFNKYAVSLQEGPQGTPLRHTFYVHRDQAFTHKESYNLLKGRAVNKDLVSKEGKPYNAWVEMDLNPADNGSFTFRKYSGNYGFDPEKALGKLPLRGLSEETEQQRLLQGLRKGNVVPVTYTAEDGSERKGFIQTHPRFKQVHLYDQNWQRVRLGPREATRPVDADTPQKSARRGAVEADAEHEPAITQARKKKGIART
ncbi:hypothetical protein GCM10027275_42970 [Rhabdobacter roseus]|uniref:DUF3945 domain-containing protein n=1 Tax=Rhabdobacter roseus TaxID=1655419 RepID=A0A840U487_9BACT|nr:hypothetical protein [Rhabdobacter roseus]MBB5286649.1 hypothetical protein [Rhabdobacter roseus]